MTIVIGTGKLESFIWINMLSYGSLVTQLVGVPEITPPEDRLSPGGNPAELVANIQV